jgi:putative ABC transport system permease protein
MRLATAGLALGMTATFLSTQTLVGFLYEVEPNDPVTLLTASAALALVSAAACLVPACRATAVDPATVLKTE